MEVSVKTSSPGPSMTKAKIQERKNTERYRRRLIKQLERLGHQVTLQPLPEAA